MMEMQMQMEEMEKVEKMIEMEKEEEIAGGDGEREGR